MVVTTLKPLTHTDRSSNTMLKSIMNLVRQQKVSVTFFSTQDSRVHESRQKFYIAQLDEQMTMERFRSVMEQGKLTLGKRHEQTTQ